MKRLLAVIFLAVVAALGAGGAPQALAAAAPAAGDAAPPRAEIFATSNTAIITDPRDPRLSDRLVGFEHQVDDIIDDGGADAGRSTLLDGVFWSSSLQTTTYERSREFDVSEVTPARLHDIAAAVRTRFHQESVLTFELLPRSSPRADSIEVEVPGIDVRHLHDALVADPVARDHLGGGSVTLRHRLVLVAAITDTALVRNLVAELGGSPASTTMRFGRLEFV
jgi:hypothetical protein